MTAFPEYARFDAVGLAELVKRREVDPVTLVEEAIARIERVDARLNAVVCKLYAQARAEVRARAPEGPLGGVPFLIKDFFQTVRGAPTTHGSRFFRGHVADQDSELVRRYRAAGLVFVGKTNTPELALLPVTESELHGPARNPWDVGRTPGGSSGGAAAAVAAGIVPAAHGGDGGGSIRIPASCCGLFGLKPTRARTPSGPMASENWSGFSVEHVISRSVRDSAALLDATAGPEPTSPYHAPPPARPYADEVRTPPGRLKIAFHTDPAMPSGVHPDVTAAVDDAARLCESLGHRLVEVRPNHERERLARAFFTVIAGQTSADLAEAMQTAARAADRRDFEKETWLLGMLGRKFSALDYALAVRTLQAEARRLTALYADYDVVLTPTLSCPPLPIGALRAKGAEALLQEVVVRAELHVAFRLPGVVEQAVARVFDFIPFTPVANFTGQPSMSVPLHWNAQTLPIGVMFTARFGDEATLFRLAAQLEQARPWAHRRPSLFSDA